ncbi:hypothetical protein SCOCK_370034 [Actinacidiphila cocklensis]|uniref:Uncharacterized protein n=1 Tax=Actinacidiphila cocklensis TaxID=887465 RepID=A0A9W4DTC7_9ACTN|nr:hypothetical protein SCOCK_370034 [Actinacidiphila cocklensis]
MVTLLLAFTDIGVKPSHHKLTDRVGPAQPVGRTYDPANSDSCLPARGDRCATGTGGARCCLLTP